MNILVKRKESGVIFSLLGILSGQNDSTAFIDTVRREISSGLTYMILDFAQSSLPDSRFIGRMVELYHENRRNNIKMYLLCGKNEDVAELFKIAYLDRIMPMVQRPDDIVA